MIWWFLRQPIMRGAVPASLSSLIVSVRGHAGMPQRPARLGWTGQQLLAEALVRVPDLRDARGIRDPSAAVLALAFAAVLAG